MPEQDDLNSQSSMTPPVPMPTAPQAKSRGPLWVAVFIVIILVAAAALAFWPRHKAVAPVVQPVVKQQITAPSFSQERALVNAHSKLTFPAVTASSSIAISLLPADLSGFILASATLPSISRLTFADGSSGYSIFYNESGQPDDVQGKLTLLNFQNPVIEKAGYSLVSGNTTQLAASLEEQNSKYQIRIDVNAGQGNSMVNILARLIK